jgi:hypothetical protein
MIWVFNIVDRSGRKIHLSKERWHHIQKHPEMSGEIERIKDSLRSPDKILAFHSDPDVRFYFKHYKLRKQYLFISVKYLNGDGFVITSFYTDKIK